LKTAYFREKLSFYSLSQPSITGVLARHLTPCSRPVRVPNTTKTLAPGCAVGGDPDRGLSKKDQSRCHPGKDQPVSFRILWELRGSPEMMATFGYCV